MKKGPLIIIIFTALLIILTAVIGKVLLKSNKFDDTKRPLAYVRSFAVTGHVYDNVDEFEYLLKDAVKKETSLIFVGGDIENTLLDKFDGFGKTYGLRLIPVPGNHEIQSKISEREYFDKFDNYRPFYLENAKVLLLNTMDSQNLEYPHGGVEIVGDQLAFIEREASTDLDKTLILITGHALWASGLTSEDKEEMAKQIPLDSKYDIHSIQFPSNDTHPNNWMETIHPLLSKRGNVYVFSGDASLTSSLIKDGVQYYATGLRQKSKDPWITGNKQSYVLCNFKEAAQGLNCTINYFDNIEKNQEEPKISYIEEFNSSLQGLALEKEDLRESTNFRSVISFDPLRNIKYVTLEKKSDCDFPEGFLTLTGSGFFSTFKSYTELDFSKNGRIYFIDNHSNSSDVTTSVGFYRLSEDQNECEDYVAKLYSYDFIPLLSKFKPQLETFNLEIDPDKLKVLTNAIPNSTQERYTSDFKFSYVDARLLLDKSTYSVRLKNRGGTPFHWAYNKKSYTIKFQDYFKHNKKILLYIPDKRAYTGEYLINQLAHLMEIPALDSYFANVMVNGSNYGTYYKSEDFDSLFLVKRGFPEADIYDTDPYVNPPSFDIKNVPKAQFISTINNFENDYDRNIDYFMSVINQNTSQLATDWKYSFDPNQLAKIMALLLISGSPHYDFHNVVFYINPQTGQIYFLPWDFMNYTNVGDLQRDDLKGLNNDYINTNELFTPLTAIPEIRALRNRQIFRYANTIANYLSKFENQDNVQLMATFFTDPTVEFPYGEGDKPPLSFFYGIPKVVMKNVNYLKEKIVVTDAASSAFYDGNNLVIKTTTDSYGVLTIPQIILATGSLSSQSEFYVDGVKVSRSDFYTEETSGGFTINFRRDIFLAPKVGYKKEYATPLLLSQNFVTVTISNVLSSPTSVGVGVENTATGERKTLNSLVLYGVENTSIANDTFSYPVPYVELDKLYPILVPDNKMGEYTFKSKEVELDEDIILPKEFTLIIKPGTIVKMGKNASIISYGKIIANGTENDPIKIVRKEKNKSWGTLAVVQKESYLEMSYCNVEGGGDEFYNGIYFSGMISAYSGDAFISNCIIKDGNKDNGDDALNVKSGFAKITNNKFIDNKADSLDLDFVKDGSLISNNVFENSGNDHLDISGSRLLIISNNIMEKSGDKGISVGESSDVLIVTTSIKNSKYGVASKDDSFVSIVRSVIEDSSVGVASYNKKEFYGGSRAYVRSSILKNNLQDFGLEFINLKDWRFGDPFYESYIYAENSKYRLTGRTVSEVILEGTEPPKSKKDIYQTTSKNNVDSKGNVYAKLTDDISR